MPENSPRPSLVRCKPEMKPKKKYKLLQIVRYVSLTASSLFFIFFSLYEFPIIFPILLAVTVIGGAFFCGWICPMGFLQDLAGMVARRFKIQQKNMLPRKVHLALIPIRYLLFGCALACILYPLPFIMQYISYGDARRVIHTLIAAQIPAIIALVVLGFFLILSVFYKRVFCSYFCIEGAKQGLLGFLRPATILRSADTCINCKKCDRACPMSISVSTSHNVQSPQCVNCFQCISACPVKKTLVFGLARPQHGPIGALLAKKKPFGASEKYGMIGIRLALAAAAFVFWFQGPGEVTYRPRMETVPEEVIKTGASVYSEDALSGASYDAEAGASAASDAAEAS